MLKIINAKGIVTVCYDDDCLSESVQITFFLSHFMVCSVQDTRPLSDPGTLSALSCSDNLFILPFFMECSLSQKLSHPPGPSSYDMCPEKASLNSLLTIKLLHVLGALNIVYFLYTALKGCLQSCLML